MRDRSLQLSIAVLLFALWCAAPVQAQIKSGSITGLVTDSSGAVVPDATISVVNTLTNVTVQTKTNAAGEYAVPYLAAGVYTVSVTKPGFANFQKTGLSLGTGGAVRIDAQMQTGSVQQSVNVSATGAILQTESSTVQNEVGDKSISALPDINHNPYYFAGLQPNVVGTDEMLDTTSANSFLIGVNSRPAMSALSVNGGLPFSGSYTVDGVSVQGSGWNEAAVLPNTAGIQEVQTIVNDHSAEYGRGQGVVNIVTKGGTNTYHGSAYDYVRNEALNANTFGNNAQGIQRGPFKVNTFGGTVGGRIVKDKLFFFTSYEGMRHSDAVDYLLTVPTPAERKGDFSKTLVNVNTSPVPVQLFDPFSATMVQNNLYQRTPYPNAIIPNPDPYALKLYSFYPDPNRTPIDVYGTNNYYNRVIRTFARNSVSGRLDYYLGKQSLYASAGLQNGLITTPGPWGSGNPFFHPTASANQANTQDQNPYASLGDTVSFSPTLVGDFRFSLQRINTQFGAPISPDLNYSDLGIPSAIQAIFAVPGVAPDVNTGRYTQLSNTQSAHKHEHQTNMVMNGSMNKIHNNWTFKWGTEYRVYLSNYQDPEEGSVLIEPGAGGSYCYSGACGSAFTGQFISATGASVAQNIDASVQGLTFADLLAGTGSLVIAPGRNIFPAFAQKYFALYSQNDWRVTNRLTVFLGLRWDLQPGPTERYNRVSSFDASKTNAFGTTGLVVFPGRDGYSRNLWDTRYRDFGPRLGAAYRLGGTWVIRGGYGISYLPTNTGYYDGTFNYGSSPFAYSTVTLPYGTDPQGVPIGRWHDLPVSQIATPIGGIASAPQNYGLTRNLLPRNMIDGRAQQWNFVIEKSLGSAWLVSATYSGVRGDHLPIARFPTTSTGLLPPNIMNCYRTGTGCPANDSAVTGNGYLQTGVDPGIAQVPNPFNPTGTLPFQGILAQKSVPRWLLDETYSLFPSQTGDLSIGFENYESLTFQVNHRFGSGLQFTAFYTWSKSLDFTSGEAAGNQATNGIGFDPAARYLLDIGANKKLSYTDIPHRVVIRGVYELPLGRGKRFDSRNRALRAVESGWQLGAVQILQSGYPVKLTGASAGSMNSLPNRIPGEPVEVPQALQHWYDGRTQVTLPDGRTITPCAQCFLKYNPDALGGPVVPNPTKPGQYLTDNYWFGDAAVDYSDIRSPRKNNLNLSVSRRFQATERLAVEFQASASNVFNHAQFRIVNGALGGINTGAPTTPSGSQLGQPGPASFGTFGLNTFDPRQVELQLKVQF